MKPEIDIVLPCYNPINNWYQELLGFHQSVSSKYNLNFIIVNDGSANHAEIESAKRFLPESTQIISYSINRGKGYALRKGMEASKHEFAVYTDIDFPFTNESMMAMIEALLEKKNDIVVGYRPQAYYENKMSFFRRTLSKTFRFFVKDILKMPLSDTQCGLKGFNFKGKQKFLTTTINRYLFDFEFIFKASKDKSLKLEPLAVELKPNVVFSKMRLKIILQETLNLIRILLSH